MKQTVYNQQPPQQTTQTYGVTKPDRLWLNERIKVTDYKITRQAFPLLFDKGATVAQSIQTWHYLQKRVKCTEITKNNRNL
jgi:hypothetical protein